jgi:hypothetical protein
MAERQSPGSEDSVRAFNGLSRVSKVGVTTAALVGLALTGHSPASAASNLAADAPQASVSPSTGLSDGDTVTVSAAGFATNDDLYFSQCAGDAAGGTLVCDVSGIGTIRTDDSGVGSATGIVHLTFSGTDSTGNSVTVDCATVQGGCYIGVSSPTAGPATAPISFS